MDSCSNIARLGYSTYITAKIKTDTLNPPLKYLPWITVDGEHNVSYEKDIIADLAKWVCNNYKGDIKLVTCINYLKNFEITK